MFPAVERPGAVAGSTPARRPIFDDPETHWDTMRTCQKHRTCKRPMDCTRERDCYFVVTVQRHELEEQLAREQLAA